MSGIISCMLLILAASISEDVQKSSDEAAKLVDEEAVTFLKGLYDQTSSDGPLKCKKCLSSLGSAQTTTYNLMVFMSFSIPLESWKDWSQSLEREGGVFVLRGLPGNSFHTFAQKVKELRNAGVKSPIRIDPEAYDQYEIKEVPCTVLLDGDAYDKMTGNIHLEAALRTFRSH